MHASPSAGRAAPRRLFWPLWLAAALLPLLALAGGAAWSWTLLEREARGRLDRTAAVLREHVQRAFETQDALLIAAQQATEGMGWEEITGSPAVARFLRALDDATPGAGAIGMIRPDGVIAHLSTIPFPPPRLDFSDRDYVQAQRGAGAAAPFVGETIVARVNGLVVFPYSRPRLGTDRTPDGGVLWATLRTAEFASFFESLRDHRLDVIGVARADGAVLMRHPPAPSGPTGLRLPPGSPQMRAIADVMAHPPGRVAHFDDLASPVDGQGRFWATMRVGELPVAVTYGLHPAGLREAWMGQVRAMAVVAGAAALLLLALTFLAQRRAAGEAEALARARDEAERRAEAEARLRESQRVGMLGQITAGVAHDFRNLIQSVEGGLGLLRASVAQGRREEAERLLVLVGEAVGRGRALTERMLHVARGEAEDGSTLDPVRVAAGAAELLDRTLGARHPVRLDIAPGHAAPPPAVRGKPVELEAAILNFALNARDAMPGGGTVSIAVRAAPGADGAPGALVSVADTGCGMDEATARRVGEAFFTTKPAGQGTGLGLSTAHAFAREAGGTLRLRSDGPGRGCVAELWLPVAEAARRAA